MGIPVTHPKFQAFDSNGDPLNGGKLYTYSPGTTTNQAVYTDEDFTTPHDNPVVLDSRGEAEIYINKPTKFVLKTSTDVTIWTVDNVYESNNKPLGYYVSDYDDLAAALTAIGATQATLFLDADCTIDDGDSLTQPSTLHMNFLPEYTVDGTAGGDTETLTLNGPITIQPGTWPFGSNLTVVNGPIATLANDATPSVAYRRFWLTGGTTTITDFDDGVEGQVITIIAEHSITITDGTNIFLNGSTNFSMTATDTLTLICKADNKWYELSRGDNGA